MTCTCILPQVRVINPKSVTMGQLYGETDKATQEWKDGVLAVYFRQLASDPSEDRKWVLSVGMASSVDGCSVLLLIPSESLGLSVSRYAS